eukprot:scaffold236_cov245-Amphora_coffeaeformis.AAC.2
MVAKVCLGAMESISTPVLSRFRLSIPSPHLQSGSFPPSTVERTSGTPPAGQGGVVNFDCLNFADSCIQGLCALRHRRAYSWYFGRRHLRSRLDDTSVRNARKFVANCLSCKTARAGNHGCLHGHPRNIWKEGIPLSCNHEDSAR